MEIHLKESEIKQALLEHIGNTGIPLNNAITNVTLIAGRGVNGHSAIITVDYEIVDSNLSPSDEPENDEDKQQAITFDFSNSDNED